MGKLRIERWRAKLGPRVTEMQQQYDTALKAGADPNIALAIKLLKGEHTE